MTVEIKSSNLLHKLRVSPFNIDLLSEIQSLYYDDKP